MLVFGFATLLASCSMSFAGSPTAVILDSVSLPEYSADGTKIAELSGLSWDEKTHLLYGVSDKGYLYRFKLRVEADKLAAVDPVFAASIEDSNTSLLSWDLTNAEGVQVRDGANGTELLIAFEDGPAIGRFTTDGKFIEDVKLPTQLADPNAYSDSNKRLESVTEMASYGVLTAPEAHLIAEPKDQHSIYAMDGRSWNFPALQAKQDSVKDLSPLPNGRVLVLVRTRNPDTHDPQAHLRIVDMAKCESGAICPVTEVAVSDPSMIADEFEGMAEIAPGLFVIVTDSPHGGTMALFRLTE
jgi:Esterase-like activity of phytase